VPALSSQTFTARRSLPIPVCEDRRMDADAVAEWNRSWAGVKADIWMTLGIEPVAASKDQVVMKMPFKQEISQATGLFSAGALVQLADVAATWLCSLHLRDSGAPEGTFPFAVQLSANLMANTGHGDALACAKLISAGRTVMVTRTEVRDEEQRVMLAQTGTHVVRAPRPTAR
jgi:1,4-dihydroxy-2-naphthoyl-CoA hydrolase